MRGRPTHTLLFTHKNAGSAPRAKIFFPDYFLKLKNLIFFDEIFLEKYLLVEKIHNKAVPERFRQFKSTKSPSRIFLKKMYNIC